MPPLPPRKAVTRDSSELRCVRRRAGLLGLQSAAAKAEVEAATAAWAEAQKEAADLEKEATKKKDKAQKTKQKPSSGRRRRAKKRRTEARRKQKAYKKKKRQSVYRNVSAERLKKQMAARLKHEAQKRAIGEEESGSADEGAEGGPNAAQPASEGGGGNDGNDGDEGAVAQRRQRRGTSRVASKANRIRREISSRRSAAPPVTENCMASAAALGGPCRCRPCRRSSVSAPEAVK